MNVQQTALQREITAVLSSGSKPVFCEWIVQIHANGKTHTPVTVMNVENMADYLGQYADEISVEVMMMEGMFNYDIVPYKSKLEVTLKRVPLTDSTILVRDDYQSAIGFRYTATLYDNNSKLLEGNTPSSNQREIGNRSTLIPVRLQLMQPVLERMRMQTCGGTFRKLKTIDLVVYLLTKYSTTTIKDTAASVKGVTVLGKPNPVVREHIVVPHLTPVVGAPTWIHEHAGGVFQTGFRFYLQKQHWYVFSPFDVKAYESSPKSLTIINVPANRMPNPERSYRTTPTQLIVLATGDTKHVDNSEQQHLNAGNGVRFIDASKVFGGFGTTGDNKLVVEKAKNVNEIVIDPRETGLNFIKQSASKITSNYMKEYSDLAARSGSYIQYTWENSNPDLLYPGMAVRIMYLGNDIPEEMFGVLLGAHSFSTSDTKGMVNKRFNSKTVLTVFINRNIQVSANA